MTEKHPTANDIDPGCLPAWETAELPQPPPFTPRGVIQAIGPGVIVLGFSIGTGEWLLGPAVTARYGGALLWLATVAILLQLVLNWECARYSLATGEPVFTAYMRCRPGPRFWGVLYFILDAGLLWPTFAAAVATLLASACLSAITGNVGYLADAHHPRDHAVYLGFAYGMMILCVVLVSFGGKVYNALQKAMYFMVVWILAYLIFVDLFLVSPETWGQVVGGFVQIGHIPRDRELNWGLIAGFAAFAGAGGLSNATIGNYLRDKGWGMGQRVGAIPSAVGSQAITLSPVGCRFLPTPENLRRWAGWWKIVFVDQAIVWTLGCFLGMLLPALLTVQFVPAGMDFTASGNQMKLAAIQASAIAAAFPQAQVTFYVLTMLCGFWILFSTQLGVLDHFSRRWTDILWTAGMGKRGAGVKRIYYGIVLLYTAWGALCLHLKQPVAMLLITSVTQGFAMAVCALHTGYINRRFLPAALRPPLWREALLLMCALFYVVTTSLAVAPRVRALFVPTPTKACAPLRYHVTAPNVAGPTAAPLTRPWNAPS